MLFYEALLALGICFFEEAGEFIEVFAEGLFDLGSLVFGPGVDVLSSAFEGESVSLISKYRKRYQYRRNTFKAKDHLKNAFGSEKVG